MDVCIDFFLRDRCARVMSWGAREKLSVTLLFDSKIKPFELLSLPADCLSSLFNSGCCTFNTFLSCGCSSEGVLSSRVLLLTQG